MNLQEVIVLTVNERIGYARVSSAGQNLDSQIDTLKEAGCTKIYSDKVSGSSLDRPGWAEFMSYIRPQDTLVITELSRMSCSALHLLQTVKELELKEVELVSLGESIDTTTPTGRCFLALIGAVSQMEKEIKAECAEAGRAAAKARGKSDGRPRIDPDKLKQAKVLYGNTDKTAAEICQLFGFSRRTLFSYLQSQKAEAVS